MITDIKRWTDLYQSTNRPSWFERNNIIAQFIPEYASVLDIGAGNKDLKKLISATCEYQALDCVGDESTIIIDFNKDDVKDMHLDKVWDIAVCSGVMEYINDPMTFLTFVSKHARIIILSYIFEKDRTYHNKNGWVKGLDYSDLMKLLSSLNIECVEFFDKNYLRHSLMILESKL